MKLHFNEENMDEKQKLKKTGIDGEKMIISSYLPSEQKRHVKKKTDLDKIFKEIHENRDHSWIEDILIRNKDNLSGPALFYRGTTISYEEMFENIIKTTKALIEMGVKQYDEVPMCVANCPEMIYFLGALNLIGARPNIFGADFDKKYIKEIVSSCNSKLFIATDNLYEEIKEVIEDTNRDHKILISLTDSLKDGVDPYAIYDDHFYKFVNKVNDFKKCDNTIMSFGEFLEKSKEYKGALLTPKVGLDDEFIITYTSGSTKNGRPKAIVHTNNSLITMARFHDTDLSGLPEMRNIVGLAHIPAHSNTDLITSISDVLSQTCTVALEPIYNENFFAYSLVINRPSFAPATKSFWVKGMKDFRDKEELKGIYLPELLIPTSVGEATSPGEEKFINQGLRKLKAGSDKLPVITSVLSMGGGDCEHGGLFFKLYKALYDKISLTKEGRGLTPFQLTELAVLREDGTECKYGEYGRLVSNSPCTMKRYKDNPKATEEFFITDAYGRTWGDNNVWAYIDTYGDVHIKGRIGNEIELLTGEKVPLFTVADAILKDTKNVLSCEVVAVKNKNDLDIPVAHIELQPESKKSIDKVLGSIADRVYNECHPGVSDLLLLRVRDYNEGYPLTGCGKRNNLELEKEGITEKCIPLTSYLFYNRKSEEKLKIKKL